MESTQTVYRHSSPISSSTVKMAAYSYVEVTGVCMQKLVCGIKWGGWLLHLTDVDCTVYTSTSI